MARIEEILGVEKHHKIGEPYFVTIAIVEGDEVTGYGKDYEVGEEVEKFFDDRYNKAKMRKKHIDLS